MRQQAPMRGRASRVPRWVPFLCVLAAIVALAGSALTWVLSPDWGGRSGSSAARNVGQVPECTVDIDTLDTNANPTERVKGPFHRRHEELYTYSERRSTVEVVNIEATVYGLIDKIKTPALRKGKSARDAVKGGGARGVAACPTARADCGRGRLRIAGRRRCAAAGERDQCERHDD